MTGKELYDLGVTRVGCKYVLGALVPKNDPNYKGAYDCAEFASWLTFQVGKILYGCDTHDVSKAKHADAYTGYWNRDAKALGIIITVKEAIGIKGAFLLRIGGDGLIGHIVCSDGLGGTVEANSTKYGCIKSTTNNRRFDIGILIPGFTYNESNPEAKSEKPKDIVYRYTKPMMPKNAVVMLIQKQLKELGYLVGEVDGWYGKQTMNAVYDFQKRMGLTPDGEVYTGTAKALNIKL